MEEGAAEAATDGAVEEGHDVEDGGAGAVQGQVAAPEGHGVEDGRAGAVQGQVAAPEGHGHAAVSALHGQGAAPEGGQALRSDGVTASDASTPAWLEGGSIYRGLGLMVAASSCALAVADKFSAKVHAKRKSKEVADKLPHLPMVPHDSPAMGTRSKKMNPASPAMSTRSKRRLSL